MRHLNYFLRFVLLALTCLTCLSFEEPWVQKEHHPGIPASGIIEEPVEAEQNVDLIIAVKHNELGLKRLNDLLLERSDPFNMDYAQWLSVDEIDLLLAPSREGLQSVLRWIGRFAELNRVKSTMHSDWLTVRLPAGNYSAALGGSQLHYFRHRITNKRITRLTGPYGLPLSAAKHIDFVAPSVRFPAIRRSQTSMAETQVGFTKITPSFLRELYGAAGVYGAADTRNKQAISSYLGQYYAPADLAQFMQTFAPNATLATPFMVLGPNNSSDPGSEAELDAQYIMGVGQDVPAIFYSTAGTQPGESLMKNWPIGSIPHSIP
jgi:hypothetical protein